MPVRRPLTEVVDLHLQQTRADRATEQAPGERPLRDGGKDGEDVDPHETRLRPYGWGGAIVRTTAPPPNDRMPASLVLERQ